MAERSIVSCRNQIEPDALVGFFLSFPPQGFRAGEVENTPVFYMDFDLTTTMAPSLQRRIARLPLYRYWGRWLRFNACFVGTTVSEYALLPQSRLADDLAVRLCDALAKKCPLLIVKDLPLDSPLLTVEDNAFSHELAAALQTRGFITVEGQALAWVPVDYDSIDHYLARLSAGRRKDFRRKLRMRDEIEVKTLACGDACFQDAKVRETFYRFYLNVYEQSEIHFDLLSREFFSAMLQNPIEKGVIFTYSRNQKLIGYNLCFVKNEALVDKYVGFEYPVARECNLYFISWFHNLDYALQQGLKRYVAGWTDPEIKSCLGAKFTYTRHAVYVRNPVLRFILRRLKKWFEGDRQWREQTGNIPSPSSQVRAHAPRRKKPGREDGSDCHDVRAAPPLSHKEIGEKTLILDFDRSTGAVPDSHSIDLFAWQDAIRFGCSLRTFKRLKARLNQILPERHGAVLLGSGDFHHVSALLIERLCRSAAPPMQVVVLDNHPDNMRFPFGIHCGSWIAHVARFEKVFHVHVLGISSHDVSLEHVLENRLRPLYAGKLTYWCLNGEALWARRMGLGHAIRGFNTVDELLAAFAENQRQNTLPTYLSIDKDVLSEEHVCTNWDQGHFTARQLFETVALLKNRLIGSDITGEISSWTYQSRWKRFLSALDGQKPIPEEKLACYQQQQQDFNQQLLAVLGRAIA